MLPDITRHFPPARLDSLCRAGRRSAFARDAAATVFATALLLGLPPRTGLGAAFTYYGATGGTVGSGTSLDAASFYGPTATLPSNTSDVLLDSKNAITTTLTFGATATSLSMESLNMTGASTKATYNIGATGASNLTLTLGGNQGFTNPYSTNTDDLIYVQSGGNALNIFGPNQGTGAGTLGVTLASNGNFDVTTSAVLSISAPISGAFNVTKTGAGTLNLTGINPFSGTFASTGGTTNLGVNGALGSVSKVTLSFSAAVAVTATGLTNVINDTAAVTLNNTSKLTLAGGTETIGSLTSNSGSTANLVIGDSGTALGGLTVGADNTSTSYYGTITGTHAATNAVLTKVGTGTLSLFGANTFTGGVALNSGTLQVNGTETAGTSGPLGVGGTISFNGGTLQYSSTNTFDYSSRFSTGSGQAYNILSGLSVTFASALTSAGGSLTKSGAGTLTLSGANTFTGGVTISAGIISLGSAEQGTAGPLGETGAISFTGGALQYSAANQYDYSSRFSTAANQSYRIATNSQSVTFASPLTSAGGSLTKTGAGTLTLADANTFTGGVAINTGVLSLAAAENAGTSGPLGASGTITFNGGTLQYSATNTFDYSSRFSTAASQLYRIDTNGQNATFASPLTSSGGSLTKLGVGTLTLADANTYTGSTTVNAGVLSLAAVENAGTSGPLGVGGTISFTGGALQYSAANQYDYSSRFSTAASQLYTVDTNGQNVTFASPLTSAGGSLTKLGGGILTLASSNTYTGGTTVSAGTLQISNAAGTSATGSGAVTVNNAGTLQGSGYVNAGGNVITVNGTLSPGVGTGALGTITLQSSAATGALTLNSTSVLMFAINSTGKDLIALGGSTLALNGGTLALNLPDMTSTGIDYTATYPLFTGVAGLTGTGFGTVSGYDSTDYTPVFTLNGTEYDLNFTAVPEPSTLISGAMASVVVGWSQRRRARAWLAA